MKGHRHRIISGRLAGSVTVETAMIFPLTLLIVLMLLQVGNAFSWRIYVHTVAQEGMRLCRLRERQGAERQEAQKEADRYMAAKTGGRTGVSAVFSWAEGHSFLSDSLTLYAEGSCAGLLPVSFQTVVHDDEIDPVLFRDRVDLITELLGRLQEEGSKGKEEQ